ncbi:MULTISPECIES: ergothioneine biosynthesis protein EgtB [Exiguobacterium]|uniref:ergothioneine biosynthesis protein EgtB n=1 Tax=Exiguobacterium TaxID=33986 RepID=UPI001BAA3C39|nr:ergothioneine biosynthesis protein EgtB [Exiguobacterium alkaliphilum]QUE87914.1 ergothioneine biosynthesis protein EgtB [Exiguobacterium alkaliphilum]
MSISTQQHLIEKFNSVRTATMNLVSNMETEDFVIQGSSFVSPTKWHLAHTTWFFEQFVLKEYIEDYIPFDSTFFHLFNSYYESVGKPHPQAKRGNISRPTVSETLSYRRHVDAQMELLFKNDKLQGEVFELVEIGLQHEQQHQELILMDILYNFSFNPIRPVFNRVTVRERGQAPVLEFHTFDGGMAEIGHDDAGFSFDNERPRHKIYLHPFKLANRPVTNAEYQLFIEAGGYKKAEFWLSDGWNFVKENKIEAPAYWQQDDAEWSTFTLNGLQPLDPSAPVCHVSFYEADAYARWAGYRLPTEQEWEVALGDLPTEGQFMEDGYFHPDSQYESNKFMKAFGDVWEWTQSPYMSYPRSKPLEGALGEYNAKFMSNQIVLKGGACVTPRTHIRATYRNFFYPHMRWQFSGIRLADNV